MRLVLLILSLFLIRPAFAQENDLCANATVMCGGQTYSSTNENATVICNGEDGPCTGGLFCFGPNNTVWFTFTTNASGGAASVNLSNIVSINGDDTLQVALLYASVPCVSSTYTVAACRNAGTNTFSVSAPSLMPNRQYFIVIDGKGSTPPFGQCSFDISVTGPAVEKQVNVVTDPPSTCSAQDGSITASSLPGSSFSLNSGSYQSSGTFNGLAAGSYTLTVRYPSGCDTTLIVSLPTSTITYAEGSATPSSCSQNTGTISITKAAGGTRPYIYAIGSNNQTDSTFTGLAPGTYTVTISDASDPSCNYSVSVTVPQDKADVTTSTVNPNCNLSNGSITVSASGGGGAYQYAISPVTGTQTGNTFSGLPKGNYFIMVSSGNGCTDTLELFLDDRSPITDVQYSTTAVDCGSTSPGSAQVTSVSGGTAPYQYSLNGGAFQSSPSFPQLIAGVYTLVTKDAAGCELEKELVIPSTGNPICNAGPDKKHYPGVTTVLEGMASEGTYSWEPNVFISDTSVLNPTVSPLRDIHYTMTVITAAGCICSDEVYVMVVPPIVPIPNAFSPNDDNVNDTWFIPNLEFYDECIVDVYTRWGQKIFHSDGYEREQEWDGKVAGLDAPAANYYFVINLNTKVEGFQDIYTGSLLLVR